MKNNSKTLLCLLILVGFQISFAQQPIGSVKAPLKANYKGIPTHIGNPFGGFLTCDPNDSIVFKGNTYYFEDVKIGKIKSANMIFEAQKDTLQSVTILLKDEIARHQAIRQAQKQFGESNFSQSNMLNIHTWQTNFNSHPITISLTYASDEATSEMLIKKASIN